MERMASGDFREDLYYRLNVIHLIVPPLRERGADILLLFNHYLAHYCQTHGCDLPAVLPSTEGVVLGYAWPGNVRELKNVVERLVVRHHGGVLGPDVLPVEMRRPVASSVQTAPAAGGAPVTVVRQYPAADAAWTDMVVNGKSFWTVVHPLFIERELTKTDVREIIRRGLEQTQGSYRKLIDLFHMMPGDYKRFLAFLYQHDCHLPFHPFRESRSESVSAAAATG
jgi:DNA-binding NtrC family response regulator